MTNSQKITQDAAFCETNKHGRLLSANQRFCRMFGFKPEDIPWHYVIDLYRHEKDWKAYRDNESAPGDCNHFFMRLRNRRGRSFKCVISRTTALGADGQIVYRNVIKKASGKSSADHQKKQNSSVVRFPEKHNSDNRSEGWNFQKLEAL